MRLPVDAAGARSARASSRLDARPHRGDLAASRRAGSSSPLGHVGNNEAVAAGVADRGWPISVVADDSSFPELFERFRAPARGVGRPRHPVAQPARDLRRPPAARDARPARRLGLPPRRHPGPPVRRVDDAAGRPGDARREDRTRGSCRSRSAGRPTAGSTSRCAPPIESPSIGAGRAPARDPGDRRRARRRPIGAAPEQWYSFKPMWPATAEEAARARGPRRGDARRRGAAPDAAGAGRPGRPREEVEA